MLANKRQTLFYALETGCALFDADLSALKALLSLRVSRLGAFEALAHTPFTLL